MKVVGVKQLKTHLSEYLRLVKGGTTILVSERDDVIAELRPARRQRAVANELEEVLDALAAAGQLTRASLPKRHWTWRTKGLGLPPGTAADALAAVRSDR